MSNFPSSVTPKIAAACACVAITFAWLNGVADLARPAASQTAAVLAAAAPAQQAASAAEAPIRVALAGRRSAAR
jgi:hypothetical protein